MFAFIIVLLYNSILMSSLLDISLISNQEALLVGLVFLRLFITILEEQVLILHILTFDK